MPVLVVIGKALMYSGSGLLILKLLVDAIS